MAVTDDESDSANTQLAVGTPVTEPAAGLAETDTFDDTLVTAVNDIEPSSTVPGDAQYVGGAPSPSSTPTTETSIQRNYKKVVLHWIDYEATTYKTPFSVLVETTAKEMEQLCARFEGVSNARIYKYEHNGSEWDFQGKDRATGYNYRSRDSRVYMKFRDMQAPDNLVNIVYPAPLSFTLAGDDAKGKRLVYRLDPSIAALVSTLSEVIVGNAGAALKQVDANGGPATGLAGTADDGGAATPTNDTGEPEPRIDPSANYQLVLVSAIARHDPLNAGK